MKEEEDIYAQIIKDSNKRLLTLQVLSNFFNTKDLINVSIRTKIIHNLFEKNQALDCNKLELFHLQFTDSIIELFQKLKKSKEQQHQIISDEIDVNEDVILSLNKEIEKSNFVEASKIHSQNMSKKIEELYQSFASEQPIFLSWSGISSFSNSAKSKYYREINSNQYHQLRPIDRKVYQNNDAIIEKKLLGRLNILKFKIKFLCGLKYNQEMIEVFEFRDSNDKFIYVENDKSFYFLENENAKGIDLSKNSSNIKQVIVDLKTKNDQLKNRLITLKTDFSETVQNVLKEYLEKISSINFIDDLQNVDEQTNILKTMLNININ